MNVWALRNAGTWSTCRPETITKQTLATSHKNNLMLCCTCRRIARRLAELRADWRPSGSDPEDAAPSFAGHAHFRAPNLLCRKHSELLTHRDQSRRDR